MVCKPAQRVSAITMALLMLISTAGLAMDAHYCQGKLKSVSLLGKAKNCHEKIATRTCHKAQTASQNADATGAKECQKNCCHNETIVVESLDTEFPGVQLQTVTDYQLEFIAAFAISWLASHTHDNALPQYLHYRPPIPKKDICLLFQSFLI